MLSQIYVLMILSLLTLVTCNNIDNIKSEFYLDAADDIKNWKDPNDPFGKDTLFVEKPAGECSGSKAALITCQNSREILEKRMEKMEVAAKLNLKSADYFREFITLLVEKLKVSNEDDDPLDFDIHILMSGSDWSLLNNFAFKSSYQTPEYINSTYHTITQAMKGIKVKSSESYSWKKQIENYLPADLETITYIVVLLSCGMVLITLPVVSHFSWKQLFWRTMVFIFVISIPWNWFHLYKVSFAKKQMEVLKDLPKECNGTKITAFGSIIEWARSTFTFRRDPCIKYYEAISIDPMWEVPPTKAMAVTLTKFFLEPFQHLGESFGQFFRALFSDLPITVWPLALLTFLLLAILVIVIVSGYQIRLPFFLAIEPAGKEPQNIAKELELIRKECNRTREITENLQRGQQQLLDGRGRPELRGQVFAIDDDPDAELQGVVPLVNERVQRLPEGRGQLEIRGQAAPAPAPLAIGDPDLEQPVVEPPNEGENENDGLPHIQELNPAKKPVQETRSDDLNDLSRGDAFQRRAHIEDKMSEDTDTSREANNSAN